MSNHAFLYNFRKVKIMKSTTTYTVVKVIGTKLFVIKSTQIQGCYNKIIEDTVNSDRVYIVPTRNGS